MKILLTGGSGAVGKAVVQRLVQAGHALRVIGRRSGLVFEGAEYQSCDVNDYPRLREAMRGCEAVVHLAAIPNPGQASPEEIFRVNCSGAFNIFQAAAEEGIRRVVQASSINAAGQFYGLQPAPLHYLPLDEEHPVFSTDAYSFSKHVIEETGEYFWRRAGISSLALRLPWVTPSTMHQAIAQRREGVQRTVDRLLALSSSERRSWFESAWKTYNAFRAGRPYEISEHGLQVIAARPEEERVQIGAMGSRVNFFTMLDERDSAQAVEKGLGARFEGAHTLFINDSQNWTGIETSTLAELFYPDVPVHKKKLPGTQSLVSIDRARALIAFEPEFSFGKG